MNMEESLFNKESSLAESCTTMPPLQDYSDALNHHVSMSARDFSQVGLTDLNEELSDYNLDDDDDEEEGGVTNLKSQAALETRKSLARTETRAVSCLRYVVLLVILLTAVGISVATYLYARQVEQESFEAEFASVAVVTLRSFVEAVEHKLNAMDSVAATITATARATDQTFPNVTIPDFEIANAALRTQTDSIYTFWLPLVTEETRAGFEAYTQDHQSHLWDSFFVEEGFRQYQDAYFNITEDNNNRLLHIADPGEHPLIHEHIWGRTDLWGTDAWLDPTTNWAEPVNTGPYFPVWQMSPMLPVPSVINFNFMAFEDLKSTMLQTLETEQATLSYLQTNHTGDETEDLIRMFMIFNQYRHQSVQYDADPLTQLIYPVFDGFIPAEKKITGVILTTIFWRLLFANVLSEHVEGVICVVSSGRGQDDNQVTYRIDGQTATLVGPGDLHETKYNDMGVTRDIAAYISERQNVASASYTGVGLSGDSYSIHVYPSQHMEDSYHTNDPIIYAVVVFSVFILTSLVFLLYDCLVERRQKKVMDRAVKSTAVVQSIFPSNVQERLYAEADEEAAKKKGSKKEADAWKAASYELAPAGDNHSLGGSSSNNHLHQGKQNKGRPIADKFENVTVLFADLVGFTKWSSTREPEEVFELLETLYGAFDKAAMRREVFKVETIGDCYMACTGLPKPQEDHAVRMAKFARDCVHKMDNLLLGLEVTLGPGTRDLAIRVGLHSGNVTAGVLRGDKGRFQLFGGTVNFASRMESTGVPGCIHCSQETAKLLPNSWLSLRKEMVHAKGVGQVKTYFVDAGAGTRSSSGQMSCAFDELTCNDDDNMTNASTTVGTDQFHDDIIVPTPEVVIAPKVIPTAASPWALRVEAQVNSVVAAMNLSSEIEI